jgi:hypothetical protein
VLWCVPTALIVAGIFAPAARAVLWIPSLTIMGVACLANARHCGRLHCHITGPVFLLGAIASVLDALAVVSIDWKLVIAGTAIGTLVAYALERTRGKYVEASVPSAAD